MELPRYASDYNLDNTTVSFSYLLELAATLREYRGSLVLIGGWAPFFILEDFKRAEVEFTHIGSLDIDLAVDPQLFSKGLDKYRSIIEHIQRIGYVQKKDRLNNIVPSSFVKKTKENVDIQVDFLTDFDVTAGKTKRHVEVQQDLMARRAKGCDTAFKYNWECPLSGNLPGNGEIKLNIRVATIVSTMVMKGYAVGERLDGKDPYDIYALITYYKNGPSSVAEEFKLYTELPMASEALKIIDENFKNLKSNGPQRVGYFMYPNDVVMREKAITDAYMNIREFLRLIED